MLKVKTSAPYYPPENISADSIRNQLQRILASPEFTATESQQKFLKFVVLETLSGNSDEIKGFTVATFVFGRGDDFDQAIDPIVSIQAGKLRRALERYYLTGGKQDTVHITIPKGTYVPVFSQSIEANTEARYGKRNTDFHPGESWPTILVRPFTNFTGDKNKDFLGTGFATEIATEISRFEEIPVLLSGPENPINERQKSTFQFIIDGSIRSDEDS